MSTILAETLEEVRGDRSGTPAEEVAGFRTVDPDELGACVATVDGHVYEEGDTRFPLLLQSISKPFTYGLALADRGVQAVDRRIDVEPSGEAYSEISLDERTKKPRNPMINAGAIAAAALVAGSSLEERFERIVAHCSAYAGRLLTADEAVFSSESFAGHRNRAIAHLLRWAGIVEGDPEPALALYGRQCAVEVDCRDLSVMAATLANGGVNPRTGEVVLATSLVERVLSVMATCGMYDAAGAWVADVGMPAKSGIGGGIIAVLPGQLGIAVYSPRLDHHGNSVRGVAASRTLSRALELHLMHVGRGARSAIRARYDVRTAPSLRRRTEVEQKLLQRVGAGAQVLELHGDLLFSGAERVVRAVEGRFDELELLVLDVRRVDEVSDVARRLLGDLRAVLRAHGKEGVLVDPEQVLEAPESTPGAARAFHTRDAAVAWCEDRLLDRHGGHEPGSGPLALAEHPFVADLGEEAIAVLEGEVVHRRYGDQEVILQPGEPCPGLHLITGGRVRVSTPGATDRSGQRILTLSAGMSLGERALSSSEPQATEAVADGEVTLALLPVTALERLQREQPAVALLLWRTMARDAHVLLDRLAEDLAGRSEAAT